MRKRKLPITSKDNNAKGSNNPHTTRKVIRRFHTLLKDKSRVQSSKETSAAKKRLVEIDNEIDELGGLQAYQRMSTIGQGKDRGGGSEKALISWLRELGCHSRDVGRSRCVFIVYGTHTHVLRNIDETSRMLEVGALKPDNYAACSSWLETTCIDLRSNHPSIIEKDFLTMNEDENRGSWDIISLSLVVNFVPEARNRGKILHLSYKTCLRATTNCSYDRPHAGVSIQIPSQ